MRTWALEDHCEAKAAHFSHAGAVVLGNANVERFHIGFIFGVQVAPIGVSSWQDRMQYTRSLQT
jgi:hypothetical protein